MTSGRSSAGCGPQPAAPTSASACPSGSRAARSVSRFLRGSSVATVRRTDGRGRRARRSSRTLPDAGVGDDDLLRRDPEQVDHVALRELGVDEAEVARPSRVPVLAPCIRLVRPCTQSGKRIGTRSWIIVRAAPSAAADTSSRRSEARPEARGSVRPAATRACPRLAPVVGEGEEAQSRLHRNAGQSLGDPAQALGARRGKGDHLVRVACRLDEGGERAADVVADPRPWMGERRDVERDAHGF